jgi:ACR3 family arsenite efflux pump ArsB
MDIQTFDTQLLLLINRGAVNGLFDVLMPALSARGFLLIIPFLLAMLCRGAIQKNKQGKTYFPAALWTIAIAVCALYFSQ